jgi:putative CocE/NonD family hydrolase
MAISVPLARRFLAILLTLALLPAGTVQPADTEPTRGPYLHHADRNVFIAMRDGTRLATDLYLPIGASERSPVILIRTPYGNVTGNNFNDHWVEFFTSHGYVVAVQDKRGKYRSEGVYTASGGDAEDGYDTIDWLSKQKWSSGRIGTIGCSYLGDNQIFLAQLKHPALKAMIPQSSGSSVGSMDGLYRYFGVRINGAIDWAAAVGWFAVYGQKHVPKLPASLDHLTYSSSYQAFDQAPKTPNVDYIRAWNHLPMIDALKDQGILDTDFEDNIAKAPTDPYWQRFPYMTDAYTSDVPSLFINSWYDFGADVTLAEFNHFRARSESPLARDNQFAIMSAGIHCSAEHDAKENAIIGSRELGDTRFDYPATYLTWFDAWLKQDPAAQAEVKRWQPLRYYLMGANQWKTAAGWPPPRAKPVALFLQSNGHANSLSGDGQLKFEPRAEKAQFDSYHYDPANPVPSLGGAMCCTGTADSVPGAEDQRRIEARTDVLVFTTEPLTKGIEVTGLVNLELFVGSSAVDTDFTAKLVDVYPDGRAFNVLENILRARYREGQDKEVWMRPQNVYPLRIPMGATSNFFDAGHRIRLEISSSNFPRFDRNLNVGGNNVLATKMITATNSVHHSSKFPSKLVLPIVQN